MLYSNQERYEQAEAFYQRALKIREHVLGSEHPDVALVLEKYADLLRTTNRENEALELEARAKAIRAR